MNVQKWDAPILPAYIFGFAMNWKLMFFAGFLSYGTILGARIQPFDPNFVRQCDDAVLPYDSWISLHSCTALCTEVKYDWVERGVPNATISGRNTIARRYILEKISKWDILPEKIPEHPLMVKE